MKEIFRKVAVWIVKHPWVALFAVVLFAILLTFIPTGGGEEKQKRNNETTQVEQQAFDEAGDDGVNLDPPSGESDQTEEMPSTEGDTPKADQSSPFDDDPERREEAIRDLTSDPAVQYLPYRGALILAEIEDRINGKLVVHVYYMGDRSFAVREWREFLAAHDDDGSSYQVVYIEKK